MSYFDPFGYVSFLRGLEQHFMSIRDGSASSQFHHVLKMLYASIVASM